MKVLVACEFSGIVRDAFAARGHDAWSCDLLPTERPGNHIQGDVLEILDDGWDLMIAHPPCTYLSRAGARWWKDSARQFLADAAEVFVMKLWNAPIHQIAIENPIGQLNRRWRYPDQIIEPFYFGDPFTKRTCLWLKHLPPLLSSVICAEVRAFLPSNTGAGKRKGQRSQIGVAKNAKDASKTFPGIANAMAEQWG